MSNLPTIFLSYNPSSDFEETLAVRLHTIGAVHGFKMLLPDRFRGLHYVGVTPETKSRILLSDYFILFSISKLSTTVKAEIDIAYKHLNNKKKILVIYDKHKGKNLTGADNCTEIYIDSKQPLNNILQNILSIIREKEGKQRRSQHVIKDYSANGVLGGIILAGLALLILGALVGDAKGAK